MLKHVARTPVMVTSKSGRFIKVPAPAPLWASHFPLSSAMKEAGLNDNFSSGLRRFYDVLSGNLSSARQLDWLLEK